jgi:hypothetical protein
MRQVKTEFASEGKLGRSWIVPWISFYPTGKVIPDLYDLPRSGEAEED